MVVRVCAGATPAGATRKSSASWGLVPAEGKRQMENFKKNLLAAIAVLAFIAVGFEANADEPTRLRVSEQVVTGARLNGLQLAKTITRSVRGAIGGSVEVDVDIYPVGRTITVTATVTSDHLTRLNTWRVRTIVAAAIRAEGVVQNGYVHDQIPADAFDDL